ncbi:MAG: alkaline phosphatase family protein [Clostridiales bacterium]|nr:alkaline phosphatase family protein [Clostridiales bacterium]
MLKKIFVLGIDGMPYSLMQSDYIKSLMPGLSSLCTRYNLHKMNSAFPVISSVAWTSFATGSNPGEHGIFGFADRQYDPYKIIIPTSVNRKKLPIWSQLPQDKKKIVINVPLTYPPEPINGYMVSCFLCTDIHKSTYPNDFHKHLMDMDYIIDVDAWLVREDKEEFLQQLILAMDKRFQLAFELLNEDWDYFQLHIMETDRLMHFFFEYLIEKKSEAISELIESFFKKLDHWIGRLIEAIQNESAVIVLSDHGFCEVKSEVQMNLWLEQQGLLFFGDSRKLENYLDNTVCYSLVPGRIYLNLVGREERGSVKANDYFDVRDSIKEKLLKLRHPDSGEPIIEKIMFREEIYHGDYADQAPDIIAHPNNGYDLKASLDGDQIFTRSPLMGMHTYEDAMIVGIGIDVSAVNSIDQVYQVIWEYRTHETV